MSRPGIAGVRGERVGLVELAPVHFAAVVAWRNAPENAPYFLSTTRFTLATQAAWYAHYLADPSDLTFIIMRPAQTPVGMVAVYHIDDAARTAEFGRLLIGDPAARRQGLAHAACVLGLQLAWQQLGLRRLYLNVYADNVTAVALYRRLGFVTASERLEPGTARTILHMDLHAPAY